MTVYDLKCFSTRPCAMVVPDFELICEIMLVAEGFQDARLLARKFITLYTLCKELLSKQDHYDWGLRAIKSVLVVAGSLKVYFFLYLRVPSILVDTASLRAPHYACLYAVSTLGFLGSIGHRPTTCMACPMPLQLANGMVLGY